MFSINIDSLIRPGRVHTFLAHNIYIRTPSGLPYMLLRMLIILVSWKKLVVAKYHCTSFVIVY